MKKTTKKDPHKLDLACGNNLQPGFTGVDINKKGTQADIEWNLLKQFPWPWKDGSIKEVFCSHFLEHIPHGDGYNDPFWEFFNELHRVLRPGGIARFLCPYYSSVRAVQDPTHTRSISEPTFLYLDKNWRKMNRLEHYPVYCNFDIVKIDHLVSEETSGKAQDTVSYQAAHLINIVDDVMVVIKKRDEKTKQK